jgi:ketosteroid isomerase-like protein
MSTTPDLAQLAYRAFASMNRGDVHSTVDDYALNAVLDTAGYGMGTFEGREAIRGFLSDWIGSFDDLTIEAEEVVDVGNGVVLTVYHQKGRPRGGSNYVHVRSALVVVWVDGMIVRNTVYPDIDEARAGAERLAEQKG